MNDKEAKILFCIMGKSGSGKDSILNYLMEHRKDIPFDLEFLPCYTTRPIRIEEELNDPFHKFIDDNTMMKMMDDGKFFHVHTYAFLKHNEDDLTTVKYGYPIPNSSYGLLETPFNVYEDVYFKAIKKGFYVLPMYLDTPSPKERLRRLYERELTFDNPNMEEMMRRFNDDEKRFPSSDEAKKIFKTGYFVNDDLENTQELFRFFMTRWYITLKQEVSMYGVSM